MMLHSPNGPTMGKNMKLAPLGVVAPVFHPRLKALMPPCRSEELQRPIAPTGTVVTRHVLLGTILGKVRYIHPVNLDVGGRKHSKYAPREYASSK